MDKNFKNILYSAFGVIIAGFVGGWIQINSRISVVEVQVKNDHDLFVSRQKEASSDMKELIQKVNDIQIKVTRLQDNKADKKNCGNEVYQTNL
jgi:hypothetical protein